MQVTNAVHLLISNRDSLPVVIRRAFETEHETEHEAEFECMLKLLVKRQERRCDFGFLIKNYL